MLNQRADVRHNLTLNFNYAVGTTGNFNHVIVIYPHVLALLSKPGNEITSP